jgi:diguanylate cyclase (GGDEF)-like protein
MPDKMTMSMPTFVSLRNRRQKKAVAKEADLPLSYRKPFLESLFTSRMAIVLGVVGQFGCTASAWWETGDRFYFWYLLAILGTLSVRYATMKAYDAVSDHLMSEAGTEAEVARWYNIYNAGASLTSFVIGFLTAYSIVMHAGAWPPTVTLGLAMGTMVAAVGRNYGSKRSVTMIILFSFVPIICGFLIYAIDSGNYLVGTTFGLLLIPFMLSTKQMAGEVHNRFRSQLDNMARAEVESDKFSNAVSSMPNGLIMLSRSGRIEFINDNVRNIFGMNTKTLVEGRSLLKLFDIGAKLHVFSPEQAEQFKGKIDRIMSGLSLRETFRFNDSLYVDFSLRQEEAEKMRRGAKELIILVCEDVTQRVKSEEIIKYSANNDLLSGLPNRRHLVETVVKAHMSLSRRHNIAFCIFDIDKFKEINDTMGHAVGDAVITSVGKSMLALQTKHPSIIVSRLGGDEFVIVVPNITDSFDVSSFFDNAFLTICRPYEINGKPVDVRASGGVIIMNKQNFNIDDAFSKADIALYKVKQEKKERKDFSLRWRLFDQGLEQDYRNNQKMRSDLKEAVRRNRIVVNYQPMYTPDGLTIDTCEALCRWEHPELGTIPPERFIALAEDMNLIGEITKQIIGTACRDCATWGHGTSVSVNLSVLDLAHFEIVDIIINALKEASLPADRLQVEITESVFMKDKDKAAQILTTLDDMGVMTAIDDFGTGYSNLSYINDLPLKKVKIDKSFIKNIVTDEKQRKLFDAIVSLGKKLNLGIVVEGVEKQEQLDHINKTGVNLIQGYLFGKPMSSADVVEAIKKARKRTEANVISLVSRSSSGT